MRLNGPLTRSAVSILPKAQWRKNQVAVTVSAALIFAGFTVVMPFLPLYIQQLGVESSSRAALWSGLVLGATPLFAAILGPVWGRLADRYGLKIMAIRISLALSLIWCLTGFAQTVYQLLILRILLGIFGGFNAVSIALITQLCPPHRVGRTIGTLQATQVFSTALGPVVGGTLASWIGVRNTFFITAGMCLLTLLFFLALYRDGPATAGSTTGDLNSGLAPAGLRSLLRVPHLAPLGLLLFLSTSIDRSLSPIIPLFVAAQAASAMQAARLAGLIFSLAALGESFSAWYSGRKVNQTSPRRFLLLRLGFGALVCMVLYFADSIAELLWLRLLLALLAGGIATIAYTLANESIPQGQRASAFGLLSSFAILGGAAGPFLAGLLASFHLPWVFGANALLYVVLVLLVLKKIPTVQRVSLQTTGGTFTP